MATRKLVLRAGHGAPVLELERESVRASDAMMAEINSLPGVRERLEPEDVIVHATDWCNDAGMHESDAFTRKFDAAAVHQANALVRGKPVLQNHDTSSHGALPVGRVFRGAGVRTNADGVTVARALFYLANDEQGQALDRKIRTGIVSEVSPTLIYGRVYCSVCGEDDLQCEHMPGKLYDGRTCYVVMTGITEVFEVSLVWAGQQRGTALLEAASRDARFAGYRDTREVVLSRAAHSREEQGASREAWQSWWRPKPKGLKDGWRRSAWGKAFREASEGR